MPPMMMKCRLNGQAVMARGVKPDDSARIARLQQTGLRGSHLLAGAGHWVQRERAAEVNELLIGFLRGL